MVEVLRLTQEQKIILSEFRESHGDEYHKDSSNKLNDLFRDNTDDFQDIPDSGEYVLISKAEVHNQVWTALVKSGATSKPEPFENGDKEAEYRQAVKVEKNLLEALLSLFVVLIEQLTKLVSGRSGEKVSEDEPAPGKGRRPRAEESRYGR